MRIVLHAENDLEITRLLEPEMIVETRDPEAAYSALQMFATSLALCSFSMLYAYAATVDADPGDISLRVRWDYATDTNRISDIDLSFQWPGLPESRHAAAARSAALCTLHHTLAHPPHIITRLASADGAPAPPAGRHRHTPAPPPAEPS